VLTNLFEYQKSTLFERDLSKPIEEVKTGIPIYIRLLSRNGEDIDRLVEFWPVSYARSPEGVSVIEMIVTRLSMGEECMIAEHGGKIIHMHWIGFENTYLFNRCVLKRGVNAGEAVDYIMYTDPEYRGNRIAEAVWIEMFKFLKRKGYQNQIGYNSSRNLEGMRLSKKLKKATATLHYIRILSFTISFLSNRIR